MKSTKKIIAIMVTFTGLFLLSITCFAQTIAGNGNIQSQERTTGNFTGITCSGTFHVILTQGNENKLKVETDENILPYVITEVRGNELDLRTKKGVTVRPTHSINVYITLRTLEAFDVSGVCKAESQNMLQSDHLKISISGSADINLRVSTGPLTANVSGTAKMNLQGKASSSDFHISGSADVMAGDLVTDGSEVRVSGMGKLHLNPQKTLNVSISGMGKVWYKGNPAINESVSGMGKVMKE
jgi:hypothetical protein